MRKMESKEVSSWPFQVRCEIISVIIMIIQQRGRPSSFFFWFFLGSKDFHLVVICCLHGTIRLDYDDLAEFQKNGIYHLSIFKPLEMRSIRQNKRGARTKNAL